MQKKSLTYKEFYLWKKSEEYWEELGKNGKTEISADISVVTHYKTKIINVRSFIKKINLVKKEEIDYGLMQVGHSGEKYIEGNNPTDSILEMKLKKIKYQKIGLRKVLILLISYW